MADTPTPPTRRGEGRQLSRCQEVSNQCHDTPSIEGVKVSPPRRGDTLTPRPSCEATGLNDFRRGDPAEHVAAADLDPDELLNARLRRLGEPWMADAACRTTDVDFFSKGVRAQSAALEVCGRCKVLAECREWALGVDPPMDWCVIAGYTPAAYRLARRTRRPGPQPATTEETTR